MVAHRFRGDYITWPIVAKGLFAIVLPQYPLLLYYTRYRERTPIQDCPFFLATNSISPNANVKASAQSFFTVGNIPTSTFSWYNNPLFYSLRRRKPTLIHRETGIPLCLLLCLISLYTTTTIQGDVLPTADTFLLLLVPITAVGLYTYYSLALYRCHLLQQFSIVQHCS